MEVRISVDLSDLISVLLLSVPFDFASNECQCTCLNRLQEEETERRSREVASFEGRTRKACIIKEPKVINSGLKESQDPLKESCTVGELECK